MADGLMMRNRARPLTAWMAIFAIALQAMFAGLAAAPAIAAPLDPATIICHSDPSGSTDPQAPDTQHDCCTQCVLCGTQPVAAPPDNFVAFVPPRRPAPAFIPFSAIKPTALADLAIHPARGPPRGV